MNYRHPLPADLARTASSLDEFANGAAICHVRLKGGAVHAGVLSNGHAIIAMHGYSELPFSVGDIVEIYQTAEDKSPERPTKWSFFDEWPA